MPPGKPGAIRVEAGAQIPFKMQFDRFLEGLRDKTAALLE